MTNIIVIHGPPGSGKTTLGARFKEQFGAGVEHVSIGDYLRLILAGKKHSSFKKEIDAQIAILAESKPLPHEIVNGVIFEFIRTCPTASYVLIDGYPRHFPQLEMFIASIIAESHTYLGEIYLELSRESSMTRILGRLPRVGEKVVTMDFVEWRLNEYEEKTAPIVKNLQQHGEAVSMNAEAPPDAVYSVFSNEVVRIISSVIKRKVV